MTKVREKKSTKGNFFQVDIRIFHALCSISKENEKINLLVVYLVIASGTAQDNLTSKWSVNAIEKYTGISRPRAKKAVDLLEEEGFLKNVSLNSRPIYKLKKAYEIPSTGVIDCRRESFTTKQKELLENVESGIVFEGSVKRQLLNLKGYGWKFLIQGNIVTAIQPPEEPKPEWVWLPNELVTGAGKEIPPIERIRQTRDVMLLRLFIDLYYQQDLTADAGIDSSIVYLNYKQVKLAEYGQYIIWSFERDDQYMHFGNSLTDPHCRDELTEEEIENGENNAVDFFSRLNILLDLGLLNFIDYIFDGQDQEAEYMFPYDFVFSDQTIKLAECIRNAAFKMLSNVPGYSNLNIGSALSRYKVIPVLRHYRNISMRGVFLLVYRPKTTKTAAWYAENIRRCEKWSLHYEKHFEEQENSSSEIDNEMQHQR